jgi:hypothetical protein
MSCLASIALIFGLTGWVALLYSSTVGIGAGSFGMPAWVVTLPLLAFLGGAISALAATALGPTPPRYLRRGPAFLIGAVTSVGLLIVALLTSPLAR